MVSIASIGLLILGIISVIMGLLHFWAFGLIIPIILYGVIVLIHVKLKGEKGKLLVVLGLSLALLGLFMNIIVIGEQTGPGIVAWRCYFNQDLYCSSFQLVDDNVQGDRAEFYLKSYAENRLAITGVHYHSGEGLYPQCQGLSITPTHMLEEGESAQIICIFGDDTILDGKYYQQVHMRVDYTEAGEDKELYGILHQGSGPNYGPIIFFTILFVLFVVYISYWAVRLPHPAKELIEQAEQTIRQRTSYKKKSNTSVKQKK